MQNQSLQEKILSREFSCLVIRGDCRDIVQLLPPGSIDLTIMDPAYESLEWHRAKGTTTRLTNSKKSSNQWFQTFPNEDYASLLQDLHDLHKPDTHCYIFGDSETEHVILSSYNPYFGSGRRVSQDPPFRCGWKVWPPLTWVKTKRGQAPDEVEELEQEQIRSGMGYHWRRAEERILFLEKGKRKLNNLGWPNVLLGSRAGKNDYPTEKPLSVLYKLVENSTQPGDVVLDLFAGSGNTGRAAVARGRKAILVDINIDWMVEHPIGDLEVIEGKTPWKMEVIE